MVIRTITLRCHFQSTKVVPIAKLYVLEMNKNMKGYETIVYYFPMRTLLLLLLALLFLISALAKVGGLPSSLRHRERMNVPLWLWRFTGWAQLAGVAALLGGIINRWSQIAAGLWLTLIMIGAAIAHLRVRDAWYHYATVVTLLILSMVTAYLA